MKGAQLGSGITNGAFDRAVESARARRLEADAAQHLAYHRRIATANNHAANARSMHSDRKDTTHEQ